MARFPRRAIVVGLLVASTALGCASRSARLAQARGAEIEETPAWQTPEGRISLWREMAGWYIDNGLSGEALGMVQRLREAGVDNPEIDVIQARALISQGLPQEAVVVLQAVVAEDPRLAGAWRALGLARSDLDDLTGARDAFRRAVQLDGEDVRARNNLGFLLLSLGECAEAVEQLEQVVADDGTQARYRNNLAFALVCDRQAHRALDLLRSVHAEPDARYNLGVAYERLDKLSAAVLQYEQALDVEPEHELAAEALARLTPLVSPSADAGGPP